MMNTHPSRVLFFFSFFLVKLVLISTSFILNTNLNYPISMGYSSAIALEAKIRNSHYLMGAKKHTPQKERWNTQNLMFVR